MPDKTRLNKRKNTYNNIEIEFLYNPLIRDSFNNLNKIIESVSGKEKLNSKKLNRLRSVYLKAFDVLSKELETQMGEFDRLTKIKQEYNMLETFRDDKNKLNSITDAKQKQTILNSIKRMNEMEKQLRTYSWLKRHCRMMNKVRKTLSKDINMIEYAITHEKILTLNELYNNSRATNIKYNISNATKTGGAISVRYLIPEKGYFTPAKPGVTYDSKVSEFKESITNKYKSYGRILYNPLSDSLVSAVDTSIDFWETISNNKEYLLVTTKSDESVEKVKNTLINFIETNVKTDDKTKADHIKFLNDNLTDAESAKMFVEYLTGMAKLINARNNNRVLGINQYSKIERRNSAFYNVAELLGCQDVVGKAQSLHIKDVSTGKIIKGTYMENVEGADINRSNSYYDDNLIELTPDNINSSLSLKKSVAKLQTLDFILGNPDRHKGNMLYQFDDFGNLIRVIGIDNDACLGTKDHVGALSGIALENLSIIPKETYQYLMGLDRETLKTMYYGYDLTTEEIEAALNRFDKIKDKIANDMEYYKDKPEGYIEDGRIRVVSDEELDKISIYDLAVYKGNPPNVKQGNKKKNLFTSVTSLANGSMPKDRHRTALFNAYDNVLTVLDSNTSLESVYSQMVSIDERTFNGSRKFRNIMNSIDDYNKYMANDKTDFFTEDNKGFIIANVDRISDASTKLQTILSYIDSYISGKNSDKIEKEDRNSPAFIRLKLAKEAKKLVTSSINALTGILDNIDIQKRASISDRRIRQECKEQLNKITSEINQKYENIKKGFNNNEFKEEPKKSVVPHK